VAWGGKAGHVDPDLADDGFGDATIHARDGAQAIPGISERGDALVDGLGEPADGLVVVVEMREDLGDEYGVARSEASDQGRAQPRDLLAQMPLGQVGEDLGVVGARDEGDEHGPSRDAQDVRGDRGQLDARILEHLVEALSLAGSLFDHGAPIAGELFDVSDLGGRDETRPDQSVLGQLADPLGVADVGLATRHVAHVAGVQEPAVELSFENVEDRLPIDPGGLHAHPGDAQGDQPVTQGEQVLGEGGEARDLGLAFVRRSWSGDTDAGHDRVLVHIEPRTALDDDLHGQPPSRRAIGATPGGQGWEI
jgi:hypothetical protein